MPAVVGLSGLYHESTACLLVDGALVAAASEERFTRRKHDARLPVEAFRWCLAAAPGGPLDVGDLAAVAWFERPVAKLARQLWAGPPAGDDDLAWLDPGRAERAIRERLGWDGPLLTFPHHLSHAASAWCFSGLSEAAVLTVDGVGEWATTAYGRAAGERLELFDEVRFPHSLGLFYAAITGYLGFRVDGGEGQVMGLAPYGRPRYADRLRRVLIDEPGGGFRLDLAFFDFLAGRRMFSDALCELLDGPPRRPGEPLDERHRDVARSAQEVLEEVLLAKVRWLHRRVGGDSLCLAGGVALNCVANGRLLRDGPFRRLFVPPAPGDAGGALGAAALAWRQLAGEGGEGGWSPVQPLHHAFLGPRSTADEVAELLAAAGLPAEDFRGREGDLVEAVAARLAAGQVVGWFQGAMEIGPRALGARSILASPLDPGMRDRVNRHVKRREEFRPFAPAVLAGRAADFLALDHPVPFMTETCAVRRPAELPAVTHVDGSARPQTVDPATAPRFAALLAAFARRTGVPVLMNTSFNVRGEPIVATPADALSSFADAGLDALAIEGFVVDRAALPEGWAALLAAGRPRPAAADRRREPGLGGALYSFV
ncbi:MAG TPA: carbamoyltransferase C-terminal domain-containing protein [Thermoanaerobaculia bacterium]